MMVDLVRTWSVAVGAGEMMRVKVAGWLAVGLTRDGVVSVPGGVDAVTGVDGVVVDRLRVRPGGQIRVVWCDEGSVDAVRAAIGLGGSHVVGTCVEHKFKSFVGMVFDGVGLIGVGIQ